MLMYSYCTHMHARYTQGHVGDEYRAHRAAQAYQLAKFVDATRCRLPGTTSLLVGDMNYDSDAAEMKMIRTITGMKVEKLLLLPLAALALLLLLLLCSYHTTKHCLVLTTRVSHFAAVVLPLRMPMLPATSTPIPPQTAPVMHPRTRGASLGSPRSAWITFCLCTATLTNTCCPSDGTCRYIVMNSLLLLFTPTLTLQSKQTNDCVVTRRRHAYNTMLACASTELQHSAGLPLHSSHAWTECQRERPLWCSRHL